MFLFPVQLTTSRTGNLIRLIRTLLYVIQRTWMAINTADFGLFCRVDHIIMLIPLGDPIESHEVFLSL